MSDKKYWQKSFLEAEKRDKEGRLKDAQKQMEQAILEAKCHQDQVDRYESELELINTILAVFEAKATEKSQ